MSYKEIVKNIKRIKSIRFDFIKSFDNDESFIYHSLTNNVKNNELNTIRVHKYLTSNKKLGKVNTARFLETINLDENTKIKELDNVAILSIAKYGGK